jgi:transposase
MAQPIWVGIDVSGKWLDVGTYPTRETMRVPYTDAGIADLLGWLAARTITGVAMEATGGIERTIAYALADAGYQPRIVNPKRVRDFSKAISPIKNDRIDACRIAHFAATVAVEPIERDKVRERLDEMVTTMPLRRRGAAVPDGPAHRRAEPCPPAARADDARAHGKPDQGGTDTDGGGRARYRGNHPGGRSDQSGA